MSEELTIERIRELRAGITTPWEYLDTGVVIEPGGAEWVCQLWSKHEQDFQNKDANGAFIAAAPEAIDFLLAKLEEMREARPLAEWHEDANPFALWWALPIDEPPYVGNPNCDDWPGYHTHWTPIPLPLAQHHGTEEKQEAQARVDEGLKGR